VSVWAAGAAAGLVTNYATAEVPARETRTRPGRGQGLSEAAYDPDHPSVAISLGNLAVILRTLAQTAAATPLLERAEQIRAGRQHQNPTAPTRVPDDPYISLCQGLSNGSFSDEVQRVIAKQQVSGLREDRVAAKCKEA
jgi:hypothetical protein